MLSALFLELRENESELRKEAILPSCMGLGEGRIVVILKAWRMPLSEGSLNILVRRLVYTGGVCVNNQFILVHHCVRGTFVAYLCTNFKEPTLQL
jgi:hypothetical protein